MPTVELLVEAFIALPPFKHCNKKAQVLSDEDTYPKRVK